MTHITLTPSGLTLAPGAAVTVILQAQAGIPLGQGVNIVADVAPSQLSMVGPLAFRA